MRDVFVTMWNSNGDYKKARNAWRSLSQNGESAYEGGNAGEYYAEREKATIDEAADDEVRRNAASAHEESVGANVGGETRGRKAKVNAGDYTVALVDIGRMSNQGGSDIASDIDGDIGRNKKDYEDR